ncbi:MAG: hypothetical protein OEL88_03150 [Sterolibacteriaceae bacterium MAG5]|nr:hypothetical protein [Candidatus Nitricoxidireducens bremensis]
MTDTNWQLQPGVQMPADTAAEVAKIACALKSLSAYASLVIEREDCPEDLQQIVDEGVQAIGKVFIF